MLNSFGHRVTEPTDTRRIVLMALLALWMMTFVWSVYYASTVPGGGNGFSPGWNKVTSFLGWQGVAGMLALAAFGVSRAWPKRHAIRTMGAVPLWVALLEIAALGAAFLWASYRLGP